MSQVKRAEEGELITHICDVVCEVRHYPRGGGNDGWKERLSCRVISGVEGRKDDAITRE